MEVMEGLVVTVSSSDRLGYKNLLGIA